jgi:hypothetical protein
MKRKESTQKQQGSAPKAPAKQQSQSGTGQQYGEGNYKATRDYNAGLKEHVQNHDIEREARDAEPRNEREKADMERAEAIGRSKSRGEGNRPGGEPDKGNDKAS